MESAVRVGPAPISSDSKSVNHSLKHPEHDSVASDLSVKSENVAETRIPQQLSGALVWSGADFRDEAPNTLILNAECELDVSNALENFKTLGLNGDEVNESNFPLPQFSKSIRDFAKSLHSGRGFFIIRGLDLTKYSVEDATIVYLGLASYVGDQRGRQDTKRNALGHITSSKDWNVPMNQRHGIHSTHALPFHSDMGCDILALHVRQAAQRGGCTCLSSGSTVFNILNENDPEVVRTLFQPNWPVQYSAHQAHHYLAPVMTMEGDHLMTSIDPQRFGPRPTACVSTIPALTKDQKYALDRFAEVAQSTELRLNLHRGDILFVNNWAIVHRREAYNDDQGRSRHLVRLWLRNTHHAWRVPSSMLIPWQAAYGTNTGYQPLQYVLHPPPTYHIPKYSVGSASFLIEDNYESDD